MDAVPTVPLPGNGIRRIAADSAIGSMWTMVSRITGLARVVVVAAVLGPTHFADLYQATNQLPTLAFELLTGGLFVSLIVPALVRHVDTGRSEAVQRLAGRFLTLTMVTAIVAVALPVLAAPAVLGLLTAGVPDTAPAPSPGAAWLLLGLLMLQVPLYLLASLAAAVQNAHGRFALAAAAPSAENIGIVAVLAAYAAAFGTGAESGRGFPEVALLGAGTTGAVLLHVAVQWCGARRCGVRLVPRSGSRRDPEVREVLRLVTPSLGYAAATVARYVCVLVVAGAVPGGVVAVTIAYAFYNLPVALVARPVAQAVLPALARAHHRGADADFTGTFRRTFGLVLFGTVPIGVGYVLLAEPLATMVAYGEMSGAQGRDLLRACLVGLGAGVVGEAAVVFGTQASFARRDGARPLRAVVLRAVVAVAAMLTALATLEGVALLTAVALSMAASDLLAGALLCTGIARSAPAGRPGPGDASWRGTVARPLVAAAVMALPVLLLLGGVDPPENQLQALGLVSVAGALGAAVYGLAQWVLRSPETAAIVGLVRTRGSAGARRD